MSQVGQTTPSGGREWALNTQGGVARPVTVPVNCTLNHIGVWCRESTTANSNNLKAAIYTTAGILAAQSDVLTAAISSTATHALKQIPFSGESLSAGNYILVVLAGPAATNVIAQGQNDSAGLVSYIVDTEGDIYPAGDEDPWPSDVSLLLKNDAARQWDVYLDYTEAAGVTVTSVTPSTMRGGQTGVAIVGTGFGASQGTGFVRICPSDDVNDVNGVNQTITGWGDTGITFNAVSGALSMTAGLYLFVRNDSAASNSSGFAVQFDPAAALVAFGAGLLN